VVYIANASPHTLIVTTHHDVTGSYAKDITITASSCHGAAAADNAATMHAIAAQSTIARSTANNNTGSASSEVKKDSAKDRGTHVDASTKVNADFILSKVSALEHACPSPIG
jgi:hypothetical protein